MSNDIGPSSRFLTKGVGNGSTAAGLVRGSQRQNDEEVDFASLMAPQPDKAKLDARPQVGIDGRAKQQDNDKPTEQKNGAHVAQDAGEPKSPDTIPSLGKLINQAPPKGALETPETGRIHNPHERLFELNDPKEEQLLRSHKAASDIRGVPPKGSPESIPFVAAQPDRLLTSDNAPSVSKPSASFEQTALATHQSSAGHSENATAIAKAPVNLANRTPEDKSQEPAALSAMQKIDTIGTRRDTHPQTKAGADISDLTRAIPHKQPGGGNPVPRHQQSDERPNNSYLRSSNSLIPVETGMPTLQRDSNLSASQAFATSQNPNLRKGHEDSRVATAAHPDPTLRDARPTVAAKSRVLDYGGPNLTSQTGAVSASVAISESLPRTDAAIEILAPSLPARKGDAFARLDWQTPIKVPLPPSSSGADILVKSPTKSLAGGALSFGNLSMDPSQTALLSTEALEAQNWDSARLVPTTNTTQSLARADIAPHVARQLVEVMAHAAHRPVEIALSPQELGRVRMSVHTEDGAITVNIIAERAETLDLMRRHIDQLGQTFRAMGYESITFAFGAGGGADNQTDDNENSNPTDKEASAKSADHPEPNLILIDPAPSTGVDIRL